MDAAHCPACEADLATSALTLWAVFGASIVGSLHCVGMCGPLLAVAESIRPGAWTPWKQLPMHAGRVITYALMGAVMGLVGAALDAGGTALGVQGVASILGGLAMVMFAMVLLNWLPWKPLLSAAGGSVRRIVNRLQARHALGGLTMGLTWGLLPCGLVWVFLAQAAAMGTPLGGALVMLVFGAGTVPTLLIAGGVGGLAGPRLRALFPQVAAASVMLLGVLMILRGAAGAGLISHVMVAEGVPLF